MLMKLFVSFGRIVLWLSSRHSLGVNVFWYELFNFLWCFWMYGKEIYIYELSLVQLKLRVKLMKYCKPLEILSSCCFYQFDFDVQWIFCQKVIDRESIFF